MRKTHILSLLWAAVLGILLGTASHAQQVGPPLFPQTLPPNTVVGNALGVTGPANALTFGQVGQAILGLNNSWAGNNTFTGNTTFSGTVASGGQIYSTTGTPTIASGACGTGTNGAVVSGSTNQSGQITIGSASTTSCTISWSATLSVAPNACVFFPMNATAAATGTTVAYVSAPTAAHVVLTGSALASANYAYICL